MYRALGFVSIAKLPHTRGCQVDHFRITLNANKEVKNKQSHSALPVIIPIPPGKRGIKNINLGFRERGDISWT